MRGIMRISLFAERASGEKRWVHVGEKEAGRDFDKSRPSFDWICVPRKEIPPCNERKGTVLLTAGKGSLFGKGEWKKNPQTVKREGALFSKELAEGGRN